mmetsp:Transcript_29588/g.41124  ORF Transcript_29588/g.41124 Transcript_29588/m.41124 type:complete len:109 (-) Transcript_29588:329-655(-)
MTSLANIRCLGGRGRSFARCTSSLGGWSLFGMISHLQMCGAYRGRSDIAPACKAKRSSGSSHGSLRYATTAAATTRRRRYLRQQHFCRDDDDDENCGFEEGTAADDGC